MYMLLPRYRRDACRLYSFWCIYIFYFSASALTLGSPAGVGADLARLVMGTNDAVHAEGDYDEFLLLFFFPALLFAAVSLW